MICSSAGSPRDGPQQPVAATPRPPRGSRRQERGEGERGVAQPAVAVVPVAHAADPLGQRRGRRGDDAARRRVGQRLERDQGAQHDVGGLAVVRAARRPLVATTSSVSRRAASASMARGGRLVGGVPRRARTAPARRLADDERRRRVASPRPATVAVGVEQHRVRPRRSACRRRRAGATHGTTRAVAEPERRSSMCIGTRPSTPSTTRTTSRRPLAAACSRSDRTTPVVGVERRSPGRGFPAGSAASTRRTPPAGASSQRPWSSGRPAGAAKHGAGVEAGHAQPVDGPVDADERRRLGVPDQRVVLDPTDHPQLPRPASAVRRGGRPMMPSRSTRPRLGARSVGCAGRRRLETVECRTSPPATSPPAPRRPPRPRSASTARSSRRGRPLTSASSSSWPPTSCCSRRSSPPTSCCGRRTRRGRRRTSTSTCRGRRWRPPSSSRRRSRCTPPTAPASRRAGGGRCGGGCSSPSPSVRCSWSTRSPSTPPSTSAPTTIRTAPSSGC